MADCRDLQPPSRQFFDLSNDAVTELRSILSEYLQDDESIIEDIIATVDSGMIEPGFPENLEATDPRELRDTLTALRKAATTYLECEKSIGPVESYWLNESIDRDAQTDDELKQYDEYGEYAGRYGSTRHEIRKGIKILVRAIDNVTGNLTIKPGRNPNYRARWLAFDILECMENHGLKATTYDDGVYFRVLSVAFREALPELGEEAHRRHGAWAIRHGYENDE